MIIRLVILITCLLKVAPLTAETMDSTRLKPLLTQEEIARKIKRLSHQIEHDYQGKDLVIVMVLKGSLCFVADLIRELHLPLDLQTVQCSSYGAGGTKRGELQVLGVDRLQIHNRDVLIVDDIFDSGHTMGTLQKTLKELSPRSLKTCVLLYKEGSTKVTEQKPDYILFSIPKLFVVGYGLDFKEQYRGLPGVYVLDPSL